MNDVDDKMILNADAILDGRKYTNVSLLNRHEDKGVLCSFIVPTSLAKCFVWKQTKLE